MSDKTSETKTPDPFAMLQMTRDMLSAQQRLVPSSQFLTRLSEAARIMSQAQMSYMQAVMRANAALFGATPEPAPSAEMGPSEAARTSEFEQA